MVAEYTLYGQQASYYSAKVRACLQYKRLPYVEKVANLERITQIVVPETGDHLFPVLKTLENEYLKDSCDIVAALELRHPGRPVMPSDPVLHLIALLLETYADEFFVIPAVFYRWMNEETRNWGVQMFRQMGTYETVDKAAAGEMAELLALDIQSRLPSIGLDDPQLQETIDSLSKRLMDKLNVHLADTPFLLGDHPSLADLAFMNAFYAHLYRDPCPANDYMRKHCLYLSMWVDRMHCAAGESDNGELYITESFETVLAEIGPAFGDMALGMLRAGNNTLPEAEKGQPAPNGVGKIEAEVVDSTMQRPVTSYNVWKLQRLIEAYQALPGEAVAEADRLLSIAGMLEVCQYSLDFTLAKRDYKVTVV